MSSPRLCAKLRRSEPTEADPVAMRGRPPWEPERATPRDATSSRNSRMPFMKFQIGGIVKVRESVADGAASATASRFAIRGRECDVVHEDRLIGCVI